MSIWLSALFLAVLAVAIEFDGAPGISWPLWTMPAARGVLIATPIIVVLWILLAQADPSLFSWGDAIATAIRELSFVPRLLFGLFIGVLSLGTFGLAVRGLAE